VSKLQKEIDRLEGTLLKLVNFVCLCYTMFELNAGNNHTMEGVVSAFQPLTIYFLKI